MRRTALVLTMVLAMVLACAGVLLAQEETTDSTTPAEQEGTTLTAPEQEESTSSTTPEQETTTSSSAARQQYTPQHATTTGRVHAGGQRARRPDLHVSKSVKPKAVRVGQKQTFTVKVTNRRGRTATGLKLTDSLPKNVRFVRATTSRHLSGSCTRRGQRGRTTVECRLGDLKVGRSVSITIVVEAVKVGTYTNRVVLSQTRQHNSRRGNKANQGNAARRIGSASAIAGDNRAEARVGGLRVIAQH